METNPTATDPFSEGDDHIRNIKITLKNFFTDFTNRTKAQIGLGNVQNYGVATAITGGADNEYVTPANIVSFFGTLNETATFPTSEEAIAAVPQGAIFSTIRQVSTNGPWRAFYYNIDLG